MTLEEWLQTIRDCGNIRNYFEGYTGTEADYSDEYIGFTAFCFIDSFMMAMLEYEETAPVIFNANKINIDMLRSEFASRWNEALEYTGLVNVPFDKMTEENFFHCVLCKMAKDLCITHHVKMSALMMLFEVRGISNTYSQYFTQSASEFNLTSNQLYGDDW